MSVNLSNLARMGNQDTCGIFNICHPENSGYYTSMIVPTLPDDQSQHSSCGMVRDLNCSLFFIYMSGHE